MHLENMIERVEDKMQDFQNAHIELLEEFQEEIESKVEEEEFRANISEMEDRLDEIDVLRRNMEETEDRLEENMNMRIEEVKEDLNSDLDMEISELREDLERRIEEVEDSFDHERVNELEREKERLEEKLEQRIEEEISRVNDRFEEKIDKNRKRIMDQLRSKVDENEFRDIRERVEKRRNIEESVDNGRDYSVDSSGRYMLPSEVDNSMIGSEVKVKGHLEFRREISGSNLYALNGPESWIIVKSETKLDEGRKTLEGEVDRLEDNLYLRV